MGDMWTRGRQNLFQFEEEIKDDDTSFHTNQCQTPRR